MKISIIGMGAVGTEVVSFLLNAGVASEIVVVDNAAKKAQAEIWDFSHVTSFIYAQNPRLCAGDYADAVGSDLVVVTAGAQLKQGETRDSLVGREQSRHSRDHRRRGALVAGGDRADGDQSRGSDGASGAAFLLLSQGTRDQPRHDRRHRALHAHCQRSRGDRSEEHFRLRDGRSQSHRLHSLEPVQRVRARRRCLLRSERPAASRSRRSAQRVLQIGLDIFAGKGNTNHGIAASVFRIIRAIVGNERSVLPVGTLLEGEYGVSDTVMSVPCVIGRTGVQRIVACRLTPTEDEAFQASYRHKLELLKQADL